jgi:hypothetical protein
MPVVLPECVPNDGRSSGVSRWSNAFPEVMQMKFKSLFVAMSVAVAGTLAGCSDSASLSPGQGRIALRLTDAPFPLDQVESIEIFVVRVEAKAEVTTEDDVALDVEDGDASADGWIVLATPNEAFDLMELRNGVTEFLGDALVPAGEYHSVRLILDTQQSSVTLKNGMILTGTSSPSIVFPSASKTGIKVIFTSPIGVDEGETTDVLLDFDAEESFVLRGNTIEQNGLLFKPVIKAVIQD